MGSDPVPEGRQPGHCLSHLHLLDLPPQMLAHGLQLLLPLQGHLAFRRDGEGFRCPSMEAARLPGPELCPEGHLKKLPLEDSGESPENGLEPLSLTLTREALLTPRRSPPS